MVFGPMDVRKAVLVFSGRGVSAFCKEPFRRP